MGKALWVIGYIVGAGDVASPFDKTVIDKTSCFATESSPLLWPPHFKLPGGILIKNETKLNQPLEVEINFFQHDFYMKTDSITTQNALGENSLGFWRDFYASNHVKVARTPETCSKNLFPLFYHTWVESERNLQTVGYSLKTVVTKTFQLSQILLGLEVGLCWKLSFWGFLMLHTARIDFCEAYFALESALGQQTEQWNVLRGFGWLSLVISGHFLLSETD